MNIWVMNKATGNCFGFRISATMEKLQGEKAVNLLFVRRDIVIITHYEGIPAKANKRLPTQLIAVANVG